MTNNNFYVYVNARATDNDVPIEVMYVIWKARNWKEKAQPHIAKMTDEN